MKQSLTVYVLLHGDVLVNTFSTRIKAEAEATRLIKTTGDTTYRVEGWRVR